MTIFYTGDTHWGHANVILHSARPFADVGSMDETMIERWNAIVKPSDEVWHLGDFCWHGSRAANALLDRLHGRIHLIWGNHDDRQVRKLTRWASSQPYAEVRQGETRLVLLHYGMRVWNRAHHGALHLYGHSHGSLPGDRQSCDVGVDCWDFRPVTLKQIKARMAEQPARSPVDHHRGQSEDAGVEGDASA
jgi:calcineurin-like phosphoesterase family protein